MKARFGLALLVVGLLSGCGKPSGFLLSVRSGTGADKACINFSLPGEYDGAKIDKSKKILREAFSDREVSEKECETAGSTSSCSFSSTEQGLTASALAFVYDARANDALSESCQEARGTFQTR